MAQLVEHHLAKVEITGSSPVSRSEYISPCSPIMAEAPGLGPGGSGFESRQGYVSIKIVKAIQTSIACPAQWDAWDEHGQYYYFRFRHGHGSITKYENADWVGAKPPQKREHVTDFQVDDEWLGEISLEEFAMRTGIVLDSNLVATGFGDHVAHQLVVRHGLPLAKAKKLLNRGVR